MPLSVAHVSDIHFGRLSSERIVSALVDDVNEIDPALVIVSGDLTQRARRSQFKAAADMLASFPGPVMVVPGNHDIAPWYKPWKRLLNPIGRFQDLITPELRPTFEIEGLSVAGINTAYGLTVQGGRVRPEEIAFVQSFFRRAPSSSFKILVLHHPPFRLGFARRNDVARSGHLAVDLVGREKIDLVLCGHLHQSTVETVLLADGRHRAVVASAGTATSDRGRGRDRLVNIYNRVRIEPDHFVLEERRYETDTKGFENIATYPFSRSPD